ncbi:aspartyl-phosphate phosphatase Spo0E family protein [Domibacillus indicus]|uniref:aspartyl-phosphate phosphatase Spo0E family protein n=1 Tax=Domibacillus indicus TaxID=1437523 RepID=UPI00203E5B90|nr:aspartyl-phosphate phosphatase Spo0E family protein [Domibacillus indicus]MCM3787472.1 aspartyl-phosphate phosphatase Spo0E family protein [Domibacillus indicus]
MENNRPLLDDLSSQIQKLRHLMLLAGTVYGLGSKEVLDYSQELDELIIQFQLQNS